MMKKAKYFIGLLLSGSLLGLLSFNLMSDKTFVETSLIKEEVFSIQEGKAPLYVTGLIDASESAVVSANTSGVVTSLPNQEGSFVNIGDVIVKQESAIEDAQVSYRAADRVRIGAEQAAAVDARVYTAKKAEVIAYSADEIAQIRVAAGDDRTQEKAAQLQTSIESAVTASLKALAFVEENKSLFADSDREKFNSVVNDLYGRLPKHFQGSLGYSVGDSVQILQILEELRNYNVTDLPIIETQTLSVVMMGQLRALVDLYTEAERDILDPQKIDNGGDIYDSYFTERSGIITTLSDIESAFSNLNTIISTTSETGITEGKNVTVSELDKELANRQAVFATTVEESAQKTAAAAYQVAVAEQSQKTVKAPFSGVVGNVFKEVGEYVQAGEPVLVLVGQQGYEVEVTIPTSFIDYIEIGTPFMVNGSKVGSVVRFSPVSTGHSHKVVIALAGEDYQVGQPISGQLEITVSDDGLVAIPRTHIFFERGGAVVTDKNGTAYPVVITYDLGQVFLVTFAEDVLQPKEIVANRTVVL